MSVIDGQLARDSVFNNAFMSRTDAATSTTSATTFSNTTQSTDKDTGAIITQGGIGVEKNINAGGTIKNADTTSSTTKDTGAIVTEGGLGVEENINAGGNITATGTMAASNLSGTNTGDVALVNVGSSPNATGATISGQNLNLEPADATNPGVLTAAAQTLGGLKTFGDGAVIEEDFTLKSSDDATTGDATALVTNSNPIKRLTSGSLTSIGGMVAPSTFNRVQILINKTGVAQTVKNEDAGSTAANRILTGTGADISFAANASLFFVYNNDDDRWHIVGGSGGGGSLSVTASRASPTNVIAGTSITISALSSEQQQFVQGDGGHVVVSANPQITAGSTVGQRLYLTGRNNDQTLTYSNGTGLSLKQDTIVLYEDTMLGLFWDGTNWVQMFLNQ